MKDPMQIPLQRTKPVKVGHVNVSAVEFSPISGCEVPPGKYHPEKFRTTWRGVITRRTSRGGYEKVSFIGSQVEHEDYREATRIAKEDALKRAMELAEVINKILDLPRKIQNFMRD